MRKSHLVLFILFAFSLKNIANTTSAPAILFVHGLAGSHTTWDELINDLPKNFYYYGSLELVSATEVGILPNYPYIKNTEAYNHLCFTMDFSDNQNLSFVEQAEELDLIIRFIRKRFGVDKVILFGHSMGGVACRQYINNYGTDYVAGQVMVTSPNLGSYLGEIDDIPRFSDYMIPMSMEPTDFLELKNTSRGFIDLLALFDSGLDIKSKSVKMLAPGSIELKEINNVNYPVDLPLVIVFSNFEPDSNTDKLKRQATDYTTTLSKFFSERKYLVPYIEFKNSNPTPKNIDIFSYALQQKFTDGIVSVPSQDIRLAVPNGSQIEPVYLETNKFHTETNKDILVMHQALIEITKNHQSLPIVSANSKNIGFIIDSSGSMEGNDPSNIRKTALKQISRLINPADNVFLIDFDSDAKWLNPNNWKMWNNNKLSVQIEEIDSKGNTDIGKALNLMKNILSVNCNNLEQTGILLFTDGKSDYSNEADWFANNNVPIHIVSYKDKADFGLLRSIASQTNGEYNQANDEMDVVAGFMNFYYGLSENNLFGSFSDKIAGNTTKIHEFFVDPFSENLTFIFNWIGDPLDFKLTNSSGKPISFNDLENILYTSEKYKIATVKNPEKGKWKAEIISGSNVNDSEYLLQANAQSPYNVKIEGQQTQNGPIILKIDGNDDELKIKDAQIEAIVETPDGKNIDISNRFKNGKLTYLPKNKTGNFNFKINLIAANNNGDLISRAFNHSEYIGKLIPGYITAVKDRFSNTFIQSDEVMSGNNLVGLKCYIYEPGESKSNAKATGIVTSQMNNKLSIKVKNFRANYIIMPNDIIELDIIAWRND